MINTTNQTVLSLLTAMKAKASAGSVSVANISVADAQTLADFVNNTAKSVDSGIAALTIAMQNAAGLTAVADIITAATTFDNFIYEPDATKDTNTTTETNE